MVSSTYTCKQILNFQRIHICVLEACSAGSQAPHPGGAQRTMSVRLAITRGHPPMRLSHCSATATVAPQGQPPHRRPCARIRTTRRLYHQDLATWGSVPEITSRESAGRSATTAETSAGAAKDYPPALQVCKGGGHNLYYPKALSPKPHPLKMLHPKP